ncbi:MAG TPA: oxalate:formate antiporter [Cyanobacteria bacterium UBA11162]|nr:oxalate:formate antiporter [Cyanobacteria bacterium UBA11162]
MPIPELHRSFLEQILAKFKLDNRLLGIAIGGSYLSGEMDEYSDIDLVIVVENSYYEQVLKERQQIASNLGSLVAAFTGEHVGEPRLLVCLYDNPLIHVDLKFVLLQDFEGDRIENPVILWERENVLTLAVLENPRDYPPLNLQWIEDRFWVWVHYCAGKLGRGELFEVIDVLCYLRGVVLAPLAKVQAGLKPRGVRNLERELPHLLPKFYQTIPNQYDAYEIAQALQHSIGFYCQLRDGAKMPELIVRSQAEVASRNYLQTIINGLQKSKI